MGTITPVYFDTNLYIYFFEDIQPWSNTVKKLFTERNNASPLITSTLLLTELLVAPMKKQQQELIQVYSSLGNYIPHISIIPMTQEIAIETARLRSMYHLSTPDAMHLATAICRKCTIFYTADKRLPEIPQINIIAVDH